MAKRKASLTTSHCLHCERKPENHRFFPFTFQRVAITINTIELFGIPKSLEKDSSKPVLNVTLTNPGSAAEVKLKKADDIGQMVHSSSTDADVGIEVRPVDENIKGNADWTFKVKKADVSKCLDRLDNLLILCHYTVVMPVKS